MSRVVADDNSGIGERDDPLNWWNSFEVNIFGVYNFVRPALKYLEKNSGYAIIISTVSAQLRFLNISDYGKFSHRTRALQEID